MKGAATNPTVRYPVGRTSFLVAVLAGLAAAGALVGMVGWLSSADRYSGRWMLLGLVWGAALAGLWHHWRLQTRCWLVFDGESWSLTKGDITDPANQAMSLSVAHVAFDWQSNLLIQMREQAPTRWLSASHWVWATRHADVPCWPLLRAALYSPPSSAAQLPDQPASA